MKRNEYDPKSSDNGATWTTLKSKIAGTPIGSSLTTTWTVPKPLGNKKNCLINKGDRL